VAERQYNPPSSSSRASVFVNNSRAKRVVRKRTSVLKRIVCDKNICFKTDDKRTNYVTLNKKQKLSDLIKQLKDEGIWEKLEIK
jgi:ectoine hydroxylase-related dioxygenase (phytanoyl-CoA dioxygenase family)